MFLSLDSPLYKLSLQTALWSENQHISFSNYWINFMSATTEKLRFACFSFIFSVSNWDLIAVSSTLGIVSCSWVFTSSLDSGPEEVQDASLFHTHPPPPRFVNASLTCCSHCTVESYHTCGWGSKKFRRQKIFIIKINFGNPFKSPAHFGSIFKPKSQ